MSHTTVGLVLAALAQGAAGGTVTKSEKGLASPKRSEESYANRWLVLGKTHDTRKAAEAQANEIREHHYPSVSVIDTNHFANMQPGRFAVVFWALLERKEALRRSQGIWNLGHRSWIRWSGEWTPDPTKESLRERRRRLARQRRAEADSPAGESDRRKGSDGADGSSPRNAR